MRSLHNTAEACVQCAKTTEQESQKCCTATKVALEDKETETPAAVSTASQDDVSAGQVPTNIDKPIIHQDLRSEAVAVVRPKATPVSLKLLTLTDLPPEILAIINSYLPPLSLMNMPREVLHLINSCLSANGSGFCLRKVNRWLFKLLPPPTHDQLLGIEKAHEGRVLACGGCMVLRKRVKFPTSLKKDLRPQERYCLDCAVRNLPGDFRLQIGEAIRVPKEKMRVFGMSVHIGAITFFNEEMTGRPEGRSWENVYRCPKCLEVAPARKETSRACMWFERKSRKEEAKREREEIKRGRKRVKM